MRSATFWLVMLLGIGSSGCWLEKKKPAPVLPPPPQPSLAKPAPVMAPPSDVVIPPTEPGVASAPKPRVEEPPKPEPPPQETVVKQPPVRKRPKAPKPVAETPKVLEPGAVTGTEPASPPPQLREILTPERRRQYESDYSRSMGRAKSAISRASGRSLTAAQQEIVNRIRTFLAQAEESRKDDLGTAWQLARRADLLGQDLLTSLR